MSQPIPTTFSVNFTEAEANALLQLFHEAVKATGLNGPHAANAIHFQGKINSAFAESKKETVSEIGANPKV